MVVFVRLHRLTSKGAAKMKDLKSSLDEYRELQEEMGVKVLASYACLGEYDFVSVIDAPDDETVFKLSAVIGEKGIISTVTMRAIKTEDFVKIASKI